MSFRDRLRAGALLLIAVLFGMPAAAGSEPARWPQFRGPSGAGLAQVEVPEGWDAGASLLWRTEVEGRGHSSPIVWGDRVFLTSAVQGAPIPGAKAVEHVLSGNPFVHPDSMGADLAHAFKVLALDAETGELLWSRTAYEGRVFDNRHKRSSYASPTPLTDGERVYAYFGSQGIYAYDFEGRQVWKKDLGGIATLGMGVGTSPVLHGDLLILVCDQDMGENSYMVALDRRSGDEVWRVRRPVQVSWSTPLLETHDGRTDLITNGNEWIIAYDPATGTERWRLEGLKSNAIASPLPGGDFVVLSAGYPQKITRAIRLGGSGDLTGSDRVLWEYNKGTSYVGSYLVHDGRVYLYNDQGVMTCLDAASGAVLYEGGRPPDRVSIFAAPVLLGDRILMLAETGDLYLVKTGSTYEAVKAGSVGEEVWSSPAVAGGRLYVRGDRSLSAYRMGPDPL